jgi:outer membrane protein assembly factor BamD
MCFFTEIENADRDQTSTWTAYNEFKKVQDIYSGSPYAPKAKEKMDLCLLRIAQHEFEVGYYYYRRGKGFEISAEKRFKDLIDEYEGFFDELKTFYFLGDTLWRRGKFEEAARYFQYLDRNFKDSEFQPFVTDKLARYERIAQGAGDPGLTEDLGDTPTQEQTY